MRYAHVIIVLLIVIHAPMAEEMIILKNETVADADDLNHNFGLIDQAGPVVEVSEFVISDEVGSNGVNGTVTVTATDPSGVWRIDRIDSSGYYRHGKLGVEEAASLQGEITVQPQLNKSEDYYFYAEDFKGNKTVEKRTYTGPTTAIKGGKYIPNPPRAEMIPCDDTSPPWDLLYAHVGVGVMEGKRWPELEVYFSLNFEWHSESLWNVDLRGELSPDDYEAAVLKLPVSDPPYTGAISVNEGSTQLTAEILGEADCSGDGNLETWGPFTFTFDVEEHY